ncbi:PREDICTED: coilin [Elephantulus edwardii]|uniref:coilin n=1 Tax=Elephantulus edwardii TaxID=28737 RepID=UPI0003F0BDEF|nr:PREDICTED: coilin [Elephantulus edwardii]
MAASETVRLRLQFDYPPPTTPDCTIFWLLVDLGRCRVVTDLISLVRQRFGFSSGACLGLYLDGGFLPPGESARLVRDNDCIRVKLEESCVTDSSVAASYGVLSRKTKKRTFKFVEDKESDSGDTYPRKHWKQQENSNSNDEIMDKEPKTVTDQKVRKKTKRNNKAACEVVSDDDKETKRKASKKKEKDQSKRQVKNHKPPKTQAVKERTLLNCSPLKGSPARNSHAKVKKKGMVSICAKENPSSSSDSEDLSTSTSDGLSNVGVRLPLEKSTGSSKERPCLKSTTSNKGVTKTSFNQNAVKSKANKTSSSSSDSSSESDDQSREKQGPQEQAADFSKTTTRGCPGPLKSQTPDAPGWKHSDSNSGRQAPGPPFSLSLPANLGRGWGRGGDLLPWKGARGRGMRGRGRGRGQAMSSVSNRNNDYQPQQQLNDIVTNSSVIIQNPVEAPKKDYSMLPLLAAPQVGEKIVFKLLELTSDYSPDISDYKEGKILSHNPETQQVDIEILSSLPVVKEPGKFDLVYHNENGTEVVEYAVTQEKKITAVWGELIEPRLILESASGNKTDTDKT